MLLVQYGKSPSYEHKKLRPGGEATVCNRCESIFEDPEFQNSPDCGPPPDDADPEVVAIQRHAIRQIYYDEFLDWIGQYGYTLSNSSSGDWKSFLKWRFTAYKVHVAFGHFPPVFIFCRMLFEQEFSILVDENMLRICVMRLTTGSDETVLPPDVEPDPRLMLLEELGFTPAKVVQYLMRHWFGIAKEADNDEHQNEADTAVTLVDNPNSNQQSSQAYSPALALKTCSRCQKKGHWVKGCQRGCGKQVYCSKECKTRIGRATRRHASARRTRTIEPLPHDQSLCGSRRPSIASPWLTFHLFSLSLII